MHSTTKPSFIDFQHGIRSLHKKIALLPEAQQSQFREMVDQAERQCSELHQTSATLRDLVDDLHLATRYAEFEMAATAREIQDLRRQNGLDD